MVENNVDAIIRNSDKKYTGILIEYLNWLRKRPGKGNKHLADTTIYARLTLISKFYKDTQVKTEDITSELIEEYLTNFNSRGSYLSKFKNFSKFCYKRDYIEHKTFVNISELDLKNIKPNEYINDPQKEKRFAIPYERWHEIYKQCNSSQKLFAVWLCLNFGMRRDEAVNLKISNVDLRGKRLHITKSKTEKGKRTFPLQREQIRILSEYISKRKTQYLEHDYLIYSRITKKPIEGGLLYKWINSLKLEFTDNGTTFTRNMTPHTLRRSFLTYIWKKTGDIYAVSRLAGHSSIQITENYLRLSQDDLFERCNKVMGESFS